MFGLGDYFFYHREHRAHGGFFSLCSLCPLWLIDNLIVEEYFHSCQCMNDGGSVLCP